MDEDPTRICRRLRRPMEADRRAAGEGPAGVAHLSSLTTNRHNKLTEAKWNEVIAPVLAAARETNPTRLSSSAPPCGTASARRRKTEAARRPQPYRHGPLLQPVRVHAPGLRGQPPKVPRSHRRDLDRQRRPSRRCGRTSTPAAQWAKLKPSADLPRRVRLLIPRRTWRAGLSGRGRWCVRRRSAASAGPHWEFGSGFKRL